ncbi:hypothetical protein [Mucilaginibacter sp. PAMB04168]|uniref:hypothetical protein n=1 Tax=Mucilaginibacter sp. PAMB04168 TaxID=3138567 RepID=UPI0031F63108
MRNFFKNINKLGLAGLVAVATFTLAFKAPAASPKALQQYANTSSSATTHWVLNNREQGGESGNYSCSEASKACTAFFNSQPADGVPAPNSPDTEMGQYTVIP